MDDPGELRQILKPVAISVPSADSVQRNTIRLETGKQLSASRRESRAAMIRAILICMAALMLFGVGLWAGLTNKHSHRPSVPNTQPIPITDAGV